MRRLVFSLGCWLMAAPALAQCPADLAIYSMAEADGFSINFSKQKHPKAWSNVQATLVTPTRHFDFEFTASNGYSINYMVILTKGIKIKQDLPIMFLDKDLKDLGLPEAGKAAPQYLIAAELGPWLYYAGFKHQEYIPAGVWRISGCQE
jgi:hypothetical protein